MTGSEPIPGEQHGDLRNREAPRDLAEPDLKISLRADPHLGDEQQHCAGRDCVPRTGRHYPQPIPVELNQQLAQLHEQLLRGISALGQDPQVQPCGEGALSSHEHERLYARAGGRFPHSGPQLPQRGHRQYIYLPCIEAKDDHVAETLHRNRAHSPHLTAVSGDPQGCGSLGTA